MDALSSNVIFNLNNKSFIFSFLFSFFFFFVWIVSYAFFKLVIASSIFNSFSNIIDSIRINIGWSLILKFKLITLFNSFNASCIWSKLQYAHDLIKYASAHVP